MWLRSTLLLALLVAGVLSAPAEDKEEKVDLKSESEYVEGAEPKSFGIVYLINVLRGTPRDLSEGSNELETDDFRKHPNTGLLIIRPLAIFTGRAIVEEQPDNEKLKQVPENLRNKRSPGYGHGGRGGCNTCGGGGGGYPGGGGGYPGGGGGYPGGGGSWSTSQSSASAGSFGGGGGYGGRKYG